MKSWRWGRLQAAALSGVVEQVLLLDVTLSLGVETAGECSTDDRTAPPFHAKDETFTTSVDNQSFVPSTSCRASATWPQTKKTLERFELAPIAAPRGAPNR